MKLRMVVIWGVLVGALAVIPAKGQVALSVYNNEDAFRNAVGLLGDADDMKDLEDNCTSARLIRNCGTSGYCCRSYTRLLWKSPGEISAGFPIDTIYVSNQNKAIYYLGGHFYNAGADGQIIAGTVTVKAGNSTYMFRSEGRTDFIGIVFSDPVTEVSLSGESANLKDDVVLTISHIYLGGQEISLTSIE